jgi:PAS domain S-box-containing protein
LQILGKLLMASILKQSDEIKPNLFTLSFPPDLEQEFLQDYFKKSLKHIRTAMLLAIFFYGFFGILDAFIVPEVKQKIWIIRYAGFVPFVFSIFFFSFSRYFKKYWQISIAAIILFAGVGIIQMILIAPYPANSLYYAGLILVFIFGYTFFKLRFIWAAAAGWLIVIAYECAAVCLVDTPFHILLSNNFFFLTGNVIGMFACYSIEFYSRKNFINTRLLEAQKRKVKAYNRELEKSVKERTEQLVNTNNDLRDEVAERRLAEKSARASESKFKCLSENSPEIIYTLEYEGSFSYVNPAWEKVLGYNITEVKGKYFIDFAPEEDVRKYVGLFKRIRDKKETITDVVGTLIHKDGSPRLFNLSGAPNLDEDGNVTGMVGLLKDITEKVKLQTQLFQAQKMEALGILAGGVAHDFNNILSAIIGYSELASLIVSDNEELNNCIDQVLKASQRAKELVCQILSFSPQSQEKLKPVEIRIITKEVLKLLRASLPSTIEIEQDIDPESGIIEAVPTQIHQLLMNLCTNAAAAMGADGGLLQISLRNEKITNVHEKMYLDIDPGFYVVLTVRDTGQGMTPDIMGKIFDPYFTTKEKGKGTGLGLAVVHGIVKGLHGGIAVESKPGVGTTFRAYFPVLEAEPPPDCADTKKTMPEGDECILFVDDEEEILNIGSRMLSHLGYQVITKSNSMEGLNLFKAQPDRFDLVITDMTMPNLTGDKLALELMKIRPGIPIILCTGYSESINEKKAKKIGIKEFSMKPFGMRDLAETTRKLLDESKH